MTSKSIQNLNLNIKLQFLILYYIRFSLIINFNTKNTFYLKKIS